MCRQIQRPHKANGIVETSKIVGSLINQLPELQRTAVIHLRDVEQYEFDEIEAITD